MKPTPIQKELGSVAEVTSGQSAPQDKTAFSDTGRPFIRAGSLESLLNGQPEDSLEHIPDDKAKQFRMRLFPLDTIVFAKSGMSAKIGRVYRLKTPCYVVSHLAAIIPKGNLDPGYLQRWLEKNPPSRLIPNDAYPSIRLSAISSLKIPLPPLDEQRRIADILDKADEVRSKRREAIRLTEELLRSAFLDMFGDPVTNPKGLKFVPLEDADTQIIDGDRGKAYPSRDEFQPTGFCLFLNAQNVTARGFDFSACEFISKARDSLLRKGKLQRGDVVLTTRGTLGNVAIYDSSVPYEHIRINSGMVIFRSTGKKLNHRFLYYWLRSPHTERQIQKARSGSAQPQLPIRSLKKIKIPILSLVEQQKFVRIFSTIEKHREIYQRVGEKSNHLFNALVQRAFKGEP